MRRFVGFRGVRGSNSSCKRLEVFEQGIQTG